MQKLKQFIQFSFTKKYVCLSVCICVCVCVCMCLFLCVCVSVFVSDVYVCVGFLDGTI